METHKHTERKQVSTVYFSHLGHTFTQQPWVLGIYPTPGGPPLQPHWSHNSQLYVGYSTHSPTDTDTS